MPINHDKLSKEFLKGTVEEQYEAYIFIKELLSKNIQEEQQKKENEANQLQSKLERINGTN